MSKKHHYGKDMNIITLDIETYRDNDVMIPYAIGMYDGTSSKMYYLTDYMDNNDMILTVIKDITKIS